MLVEYLSIFVYLIFSLILSSVIIVASIFLVLRHNDAEKISSYECGFHPFEDSRSNFDVRFYLVSILFIIFDLEVMFLFPWSLVIFDIGFLGYLSIMFFLFILIVGFFYEWKKGGLDWE